ncbi:hypothetical protein CAPTEDRAFT_107202, partial [Capitella teleta]
MVETVKLSLWFVYGAMLQQGSDWLADTQAARCLVGFWWFFCLVVTAIYTGNLIAVLAVPKSSLPIETLEDLANQEFYKYGTIDGAALS